jgi:hypothetical protein
MLASSVPGVGDAGADVDEADEVLAGDRKLAASRIQLSCIRRLLGMRGCATRS